MKTQIPPIYFHLGLPKAASTFLQKMIFPNLQNIEFGGKRDFYTYRESVPNNPKLFSTEKDNGLLEELDLIKAKFPQAKILIVFREPSDWMVSKYKYYLRKHGHLHANAYYQRVLLPEIIQSENFFTEVCESVSQNFKDYLFLDQATLRQNPDKFYGRLALFFEQENITPPQEKIINRAFNAKQLVMLRKLNNLYPYKARTGNSKLLNKIHYKYREFLLHIIANLSLLVPSNTGDFLDELEEFRSFIKDRYAKQWSKTKSYIDKNDLE